MLYVPLLEDGKSEVITLTLRRVLLHQNTTQQQQQQQQQQQHSQ